MARPYPQVSSQGISRYGHRKGRSGSITDTMAFEEDALPYSERNGLRIHAFAQPWDADVGTAALPGGEFGMPLLSPNVSLHSLINSQLAYGSSSQFGTPSADFGPSVASSSMARSLSLNSQVVPSSQQYGDTFAEDRSATYSPVSPPPINSTIDILQHRLQQESQFSFSPLGGSRSYPCTRESSPQSSSDEDFSERPRKASELHNALTYRERRREAHTQAEQKRRDGIKKGYQRLQTALPQSQTQELIGNQKASKAFVLQKSIEYVTYLIDSKKKQQEEVTSLQNELTGLQIMKQNYEKMAQSMKHAGSRYEGSPVTMPVPDTVKFQVFQHVMEDLFQSFDANVNVSSFADLSGSAFNWLEEYCKPPQLRYATDRVLDDFRQSSEDHGYANNSSQPHHPP